MGDRRQENRRKYDRRVMTLLGFAAVCMVLGLLATIVTVFVSATTLHNRSATEHAVCAVTAYAERQAQTVGAGASTTASAADGLRHLADTLRRSGNPDAATGVDGLATLIRASSSGAAARGLLKLAHDMRATGIDCPPSPGS